MWNQVGLRKHHYEVMEFQWSYFKSWKMMLWKCWNQYASTFGKLNSGHRTGKGQFSFQSQRKAMTKNKASGSDGIPVELFKILEDDAVKVLDWICQQIWKIQQWPQDWKRSVFIPIPKKGNAKKCSNYGTIGLISHTRKVMAQILHFQYKINHFQYMQCYGKPLQSCLTLCNPMENGERKYLHSK